MKELREVQHQVVSIRQSMHRDTEAMPCFVKKRKKDSTQIIYSQPPPPGPRPLTTAPLIPAPSLVLPTVLPGIPARGGALKLVEAKQGERGQLCVSLSDLCSYSTQSEEPLPDLELI